MRIFFGILALLILSKNINAHGEDKLGPNRGHIRMPDLYHVELVPQKNGFEVYLHDVNNKNSTVKDSSVNLFFEKNNKKIEIPCKKMTSSFICESNQAMNFDQGMIVIESTRLGRKGRSAEFILPLSLKINNKENTHQGH